MDKIVNDRENNKVSNNIIKSFLNSFKDYNKNLHARIKTDTLYLYLNDNANKAFFNLVNLSNNRYKAIKSGINIKTILTKQKKNYSLLNDKFHHDIFFGNPCLMTEKKKLEKSVNAFKNKEINSLREKLINSLRGANYYDRVMKEKYKKIIEKRKSKENETQLKAKENLLNLLKTHTTKTKSHAHNNKIKKLHGSIFKIKKIKKEKKDNDSQNESFDTEKEEEKQKFAQTVVEEDYLNFRKNMNMYQKLLDKAKILTENEDSEKGIKIDKVNFEDVERELKYDNIKTLTFQEDNFYEKAKKEKKDNIPDFHKLIRLKMYHDNYIKENNTHSNFNKMNLFKKPVQTLPYSDSYSYEKLRDTKNNKKNKSMFLNTFAFSNIKPKNLNLRDTFNLVKGQTQDGISIGDSFNNRKKEFDNYFNKLYVERDYNKLERDIKLRNKMKIKKREKQNEKEDNLDKNDILINERRIGVNKILDDFHEIYNVKKQKWDQDDLIREKNKLKEQKTKDEIEKMLLLMGTTQKN